MDSTVFERAERALAARLSEKGLAHCLRVSATAAEIARVYAVDPEAARLAGLLHDWDRETDHAELLEKAARHRIAVTDVDVRWPYLLHAQTAAADLRHVYPDLPAEVVDAIARHTMGSPEMTDLDRVVFLADMLEPGRNYDGVGELREAVGRVALDELFARGYEASLGRIVRQRRRIHPATVDVWNALVARGAR